MALSRIVKIATGVDNSFNVAFALGYGEESDITAWVEGELDGGGDPVFRNIDFSVPGFMTLDGPAITAGLEVTFTRSESRTTLDVDFQDGANLTEENLNAAQLQALRLVHEALDGRFEGADISTVVEQVQEYAEIAEEARDDAQQAALDAQAAAGSMTSYDTHALFLAATIPGSVNFARVNGRTAIGDGGQVTRKRIAAPGAPKSWHSQSADGAWWEIIPTDRISPMVFGAVGSGAANDYTALDNAGEFARTFGIFLYLDGDKIFRFSTTLVLGKIAGIIGKGTIRCFGAVNVEIGGTVGVGKTVTANINRKATNAQINAHGFTAEQWIWLRSGENAVATGSAFNPVLGDAGGANCRYCEFQQIDVVTDANNVSWNGNTYYGYPLTTTIAYPADFHYGVVLRDFTFDGNGTGYLKLDWCYEPTVERTVQFINPDVAGLIVEHTLGGVIGGTYRRAAVSDDAGSPANYQAIKIRNGCQGVKVSPHMVNGEQGIDFTYTPSSGMNGVVRGCSAVGGYYRGVNQHAISLHEGVESILVTDNVIDDCGNGIILRGPYNTVTNNRMFGRSRAAASTTEGIRLGNSYANNNLVQGNVIENFEYGIYVLGNLNSVQRNDTIRDNYIKGVRYGINVPSKASAGAIVDQGLRIIANEIVDTSTSGIELGDFHQGAVVRHNIIRQENDGTHTYSIRCGEADNLDISYNRAINTGVMAVDLAPLAVGFFDYNDNRGTSLMADTNGGTKIRRRITLADNTALNIGGITGSRLMISVIGQRSPANGIAWLFNGTAVAKEGHANFATATGVLNGTTGSAGNFTVSWSGGNLYVENRTGFSCNFNIEIIIQDI